jgi:hypothetical protein
MVKHPIDDLVGSNDTHDLPPAINGTQWKQIEKAYGTPIPEDVRLDILRATREFLLFERLERTTKPVAEVKVILEAYDKAADRFFHALFTDPSGSSDAGVYAHHLIETNFKDSRLGQVAVFDTVLRLLRAFHVACNVSLKQLSDFCNTDSTSWNAWQRWVCRLTEIVRAANLPWKVLKETGETAKPSDFVILVHDLQVCLSTEGRQPTLSMKELATAISRARAASRFTRS